MSPSGNKMDPQDQENVIKVAQLWNRHMNAVDNATEHMHRMAAQYPGAILLEEFEQLRVQADAIVRELLEEIVNGFDWPELTNVKAQDLLDSFRQQVELVHTQQLESFRLQKNYIDVLKVEGQTLSDDEEAQLAKHHKFMEETLDGLGNTLSKLSELCDIREQISSQLFMTCVKCNSQFRASLNYCQTCGTPVTETVSDMLRQIPKGRQVVRDVIQLVGICVVWSVLSLFFSYGWLVAVVNIGFLIASIWAVVVLHSSLEFYFLNKSFGKKLASILSWVFGFFMIAIFRGTLGGILEVMFS